MGDALFVHGGVTDAQEARLALAGLFAVQGASLLDTRTGVMHGAGSTALVTGTAATAPMTVSIAPHNWVTSRGTANGPYLGALTAAATVNIAAAPGSGTRIDVVWVKQNDPTAGVPTPDTSPATAQPIYGVLAGTVGAGKPSLAAIVGAEELATVAVSAGAVRTTDGTVLITNTARQTTTRGGLILLRTASELSGITAYPSAQALELDTGRRRWHDGTRWRYEGDRVLVSSTTDRDALTAYAGLEAFTATGITYRYVGAAWMVWNYPPTRLPIATGFTHWPDSHVDAIPLEHLVVSAQSGKAQIFGVVSNTNAFGSAGGEFPIVLAGGIPAGLRATASVLRPGMAPLGSGSGPVRTDTRPDGGVYIFPHANITAGSAMAFDLAYTLFPPSASGL